LNQSDCWEFENQLSKEEYGSNLVELIAVQVSRLSQSSDTGIRYGRLVDIL
jgi:hypothetical protein